MKVEFILYVADQKKSRDFYVQVLDMEPVLDVPGMTEFSLADNVKLGLMPEKGIVKILTDKVPDPSLGQGIPRCELYLTVGSAELYVNRAIMNGAVLISPLEDRDWGDRVGYVSDPDGHVIAFAESCAKN